MALSSTIRIGTWNSVAWRGTRALFCILILDISLRAVHNTTSKTEHDISDEPQRTIDLSQWKQSSDG